MTLARIDLIEGKSADYRQTLGDVVYESMVEHLRAPENRHQILTEHAADHFVFDVDYLGLFRSENCVFIQLTLPAGATPAQKSAFYRAVADQLQERLELRREDVFIALVETDPANWSFGNGEAQYVDGRPDTRDRTPKVTAADPARRVFVVGATGAVGQLLLPLLRQRGHGITAVVRSPEQAEAVTRHGADTVVGDLARDNEEQWAGRLAGHDAVVFCAGAGGKGPVDDIDGRGPGILARAAEAAGVPRLVLVSVFPDARRGEQSPGTAFEDYMRAKRVADVSLAASELDWLLVRPGTLSDDPGTGRVEAGAAVAYGPVPRADVAAFLAASVFAPALNRVAVELTAGDIPVEAAVAALAPRPNRAARP